MTATKSLVRGVAEESLLGRKREREALDELLELAWGGAGGVLVLHGEAGVGKTALLQYTAATGQRFRSARTAGVHAEMGLPFAALQQLCAPVIDLLDRLPDPQREALLVAFGLSNGTAPNPFLVGLAVLSLLSEAAEEQPFLGIIDDAQWLDLASARALAFVARRLLADKIALVFATRELGEATVGLPELEVRPLGPRESRELLESALSTRLDERVIERIIAETHGNPLALLELPRGLTPTQLAGGFGALAPMPAPARMEASFTHRLEQLEPAARRLLLVAAADPTGDPTIAWLAARELKIPPAAGDEVEAAGLLSLAEGVAFRHPLVRSTVYRNADAAERSLVHNALAAATDPQRDPDRRAWHRAQAATAPDEEVAADLERSAARAQARGGGAAAAAFLERSALLTLDSDLRARRALAAAAANPVSYTHLEDKH